jgi:hypothetical protein
METQELKLGKSDIVAICVVKPASKFEAYALHFVEKHRFDPGFSDLTIAILDYNSDKESLHNLFTQASIKTPTEALIFAKTSGEHTLENLTFLTMVNSPDPDLDWLSSSQLFINNYYEDTGNITTFKWGNRVPESAEYMCLDCGYIEDFVAGEVFSICDGCLAGEPNSTSGPEVAFWQKL